MYSDLQTFLAKLRQENEIIEIDATVSPNLEAAEIHRRVISQSGPEGQQYDGGFSTHQNAGPRSIQLRPCLRHSHQ